MLEDRDALRTLNSLTKYPSIKTYHPLGDRGILQPGPPFLNGEIVVTEKIDGTNARIIFLDDGYFIGSREELLHYCTDVIYIPSQGIVEATDAIAQRLWAQWYDQNEDREALTVVYGEVYGGKASKASKEYTSDPTAWGFRVFDVVHFPGDTHLEAASWKPDAIAAWRENYGQPFYLWDEVVEFCQNFDVPHVPEHGRMKAIILPRTIDETYRWMVSSGLEQTDAGLQFAPAGKAEGIVIRESESNVRFKLRFEDYVKSMKYYDKERSA